MPILGVALQRAAGLIRKQPAFRTSAQYWEDRYRLGGNSGAGSYNRLARFKSEVLNDFVRQNQISSVIEFGCGDGAQVELAEYPRYVGVDVSITVIHMCRQRYRNDPSKTFFTTDTLPSDAAADLALSLDVIYHLVEEPVFDAYMHQLFKGARHFVAIYSSNDDNMLPAKHVRHRRFTEWIERNRPDWTLMQFIKNKYSYDPNNPSDTSFADFYIFNRSADAVGAPH
jgi:SAM-dependent methyltransferase